MRRFDELRAQTVITLIERCDGFRKPARIGQLALVCEAEKRGRTGYENAAYPQAAALRTAHEAAMPVRAGDLAKQLSGPALVEAVRKARIAKIAVATGKH